VLFDFSALVIFFDRGGRLFVGARTIHNMLAIARADADVRMASNVRRPRRFNHLRKSAARR
jgi:hypothetical protein